MTNSVLQWHDTAKEKPPRTGIYLVIVRHSPCPITAKWFDESEKLGSMWVKHDVSFWNNPVEFWAWLPTPEQVRQKFRDADLRDRDRAEQMGLSLKAYRAAVDLLGGEPDGIIF